MQWSDISFKPSARTLRQFAGLWIVFFGGMACWQGFVRGNMSLALTLAIVAAAVGPVGLLRPEVVRPIFVGWMILAFPIGWTVSRVVLAIVFYGLFTPVGLLFRLLHRDPLGLRPASARPTCWAPKPMTADVRNYFRQF
jgi:hypothetical protein